MENSKLYKVTKDLRQSPGWADYLKTLGWKTKNLSENAQLFYRNLFILGNICKLQRPSILDEKTLKNLEAFCIKNKTLFTVIEPKNKTDEGILEKFGYKKSNSPLLPPSTILINLNTPLETIQNNFSKDARHSIKKANEKNIGVEFYKNPPEDKLEVAHKILKNCGSLENLKNQAKVFGQNSYLFLAKENKQTTAANFYLSYENSVWYIYGGIIKLGRENNSGYKIMWESIKKFKELGFEFLDLGGVADKRFPKHTKSWTGFTAFKQKFGGEKIEFSKPYRKYFLFNPQKHMDKYY